MEKDCCRHHHGRREWRSRERKHILFLTTYPAQDLPGSCIIDRRQQQIKFSRFADPMHMVAYYSYSLNRSNINASYTIHYSQKRKRDNASSSVFRTWQIFHNPVKELSHCISTMHRLVSKVTLSSKATRTARAEGKKCFPHFHAEIIFKSMMM
jgi:hypothetical protein